MGYRPSAKPAAGRWGIALDRYRRAKDWSQQRGFEQLREGLRLGPKSRASYVALEHGQEPTSQQLQPARPRCSPGKGVRELVGLQDAAGLTHEEADAAIALAEVT